MDKELLDGDVDVDALMSRIRESAKRGKASTWQPSVEMSQDKKRGSILESIVVENIKQQLQRGRSLSDVINQIPLKAAGPKRKLELRVKKFLKWLVHWNTKAQSDFNQSSMRSIGLIAEQLSTTQKNFTKIERRLNEESEKSAEIRRQSDQQETSVLTMFEDLNQQVHNIGVQILAFENKAGHQLDQLQNDINRQISEQGSRLSTSIEEVKRTAGSAAVEQQLGSELQQFNARANETSTRLQDVEQLKMQIEQAAQVAQQLGEQMSQVLTRLGEIDRKADSIAVQCSGLEEKGSHDIDEMRMRILRAERSVTASKRTNNASSLTSEPSGEIAEAESRARDLNENGRARSTETVSLTADKAPEPRFDYFLFEHKFRGTVAEIKRRQSMYLEFFHGKQNVVDLGCGRGEFVELLSENGINVTGVDNNEDMVEFCRDKGLGVVRSDIFDYLNDLPNATLDGIANFQVVEHLSFDQILELINLSGQKLKPGGVFVVETINTNCSPALANFYLDPSHIRPIPAEMLRFVFEQAPFEVRSLRFTLPIAGSNLTRPLDVVAELPKEAALYLDYAVVAHRR